MNKEKLAGPALAPLALLFTLAAGLQLLRRK